MNIDDFFTQFIEGYLFHDLKNMSKLSTYTDSKYGACGYPMVMSIVSGMELLGALTMKSSTRYSSRKSEDYLNNFWNNYLSVYKKEYKGLGDIIRNLVRNGLNHIFLAKAGITIVKDHQLPGVFINKNGICINAISLYKDFEATYYEKIYPLLKSEDIINKVTIQSMLDKLLFQFKLNSNSEFSNFKNINLSVYNLPICTLVSAPSVSPISISDLANDIQTISASGNANTDFINKKLTDVFQTGKNIKLEIKK